MWEFQFSNPLRRNKSNFYLGNLKEISEPHDIRQKWINQGLSKHYCETDDHLFPIFYTLYQRLKIKGKIRDRLDISALYIIQNFLSSRNTYQEYDLQSESVRKAFLFPKCSSQSQGRQRIIRLE